MLLDFNKRSSMPDRGCRKLAQRLEEENDVLRVQKLAAEEEVSVASERFDHLLSGYITLAGEYYGLKRKYLDLIEKCEKMQEEYDDLLSESNP